MTHLLTKTRFVAGCQCHDLLWWTVHEPRAPELQPDISLEDRFEQGRQVAELARTYVPGGVLIDPLLGELDTRLSATRDAMRTDVPVIYEASFLQDDVFVAVDILERGEQCFNLIEVKSTTGVKEEHIPDLAVQAHVLRTAGIELGRIELMHLNRDCRYPDLSNLFVREDITDLVMDVLPNISPEVAAQRGVVEGPFPRIGFGEHCLTGRECPFRERCWPELDQDHVLTLYRLRPAEKWDLLRRGVESIRDLPEDVVLNKQAQRQVRAVKKDAMVIGPGMREALESFSGQLAHLDFETVSLAIPVWAGFGPWHQMPVQFSCHVEVESGQFQHHEFLAESGDDCRAEMARALVVACEGVDGVVAYNASFERNCIRTLQAGAPDLVDQLAEVSSKLLDPLPIVRDYVYHPRFLGRFGLKCVLRALVPELGYEDLTISQGDIASLYLARMLFRPETLGGEMKYRLRRDLLDYCRRDTSATVALVQKLRDLSQRKLGP
jgi:hypothetical protein